MKHPSRRDFLLTASTAALVPLVAGLMPAQLAAAELPHLLETDPTAMALGYKHDSTKVDSSKYPSHKSSQICAGCALAQGAATENWLPCSIFPGKSVAAKGWCAAFVAKA